MTSHRVAQASGECPENAVIPGGGCCKEGYYYDGAKCADINECANNPCNGGEHKALYTLLKHR